MNLSTRAFRAATAALCLVLAPAFASAQDVAMVVDRTGGVEAIVQNAATSVQVLSTLPVGARLRLQAAATVTLLYLQTGDEYALAGPGESELRSGAPALATATMRRLVAGSSRPVRLRVDNVTFGGVVMRSSGPRPLYPAGRVMTQPTRIAWSSVLSEARFRVELRDDAGTLLVQQQTTGLSLPFPPALVLEAGRRYAWSVAVADSGESAATSDFEMADAPLQAIASRLRPGDSAAFSGRVVYGLWLDQAGATGEARQLWDTLARERPDEAAVLARARR